MKDDDKPIPPPLVGPERSLPEITIKGVVLGLLLAALTAAANAYLGLRVGMTVAASIPASAIALGVLRAFKRSNILESNQVQTIASAGASTVSGIIFTVPALVMMGAWNEYQYWPIMLMVVLGGVLGVVFTTPLRRALIVDAKLKFPEGVATAEVLKTGGIERSEDSTADEGKEGATGLKMLLEASVFGAVFKLLELGARVLTDTVAVTKALLGGKWLFMADATLQPSLLGIGFIVGPNIGTLMMSGAVIGTIIATPINWLLNSTALLAASGIATDTPWSTLTDAQFEDLALLSWKSCRQIGVGCMLVGGVWSLIQLAKPIIGGVKASFAAIREGGAGGRIARTEFDTPMPILLGIAAVVAVPVFLLFQHALGAYESSFMVAGIMTALMLVFGFLFCSVAGYMAGLVGSSNNPVSGVTMATVVVSSLLLLQIMGNEGIAGQVGPLAVIFLAALICTAACIAGDNLQDLKCGHIVGSTPWKQQLCLVLGALVSAAVIPIVLSQLDSAYGIGRVVHEGVTPLAAPQATLMMTLASGIFGAGIDWTYIILGCGLAVLIIAADKVQERRKASFRLPVLAVAVGIYLPFGLSVLIFVGGMLSWLVMRRFASAAQARKQTVENNGMLLASGLITGEAIMGVAVTFYVAAAGGGGHFAYAQPLSIAVIVAMMFYLYRRTVRSAGA